MSASRSGSTTICAFVALELSRALQSQLAVEIERLEQDYPGVAWVNPRKMHLTLRFLGWTTRDRLACLEPYLARAARSCPPLDAIVAGLGTFPPTTVERARARHAECSDALAAVQGMAEKVGHALSVRSLQEYHATV